MRAMWFISVLLNSVFDMEQYRFTLDRSSKKFVCPQCKQKTFVKYIDSETKSYLPDDFGKCDRLTNCQYHKASSKGRKCYLVGFLALKSITDKAYRLTDLNGIVSIVPKSQVLEQTPIDCWITEFYLKESKIYYLSSESKYFNDGEVCFTNTVSSNAPIEKEPSFHEKELLYEMCIQKPQTDNLTEYLKIRFTDTKILSVRRKFFLCGSSHLWKDATVFWQIDEKEQIHGAKIMLYDKLTGKRVKSPYNHINWLHKSCKVPDFVLNQCLFGLHQIIENGNKTVIITESEKTAIIMSIYLPQFIWMATGSKQNLKRELLNPIKKRKIVLYPDKGEFENWSNKANELNKEGFNISVSELIEKTAYEKGFDLADLYLLTH